MSIDTECRHITPAGGNIFADLGFEAEEAATLKAESDSIIAEKLTIKESLMTRYYSYQEYDPESELADVNGGYIVTMSEDDIREKY
jgi:hypothetical protein